MKKKPQKPHRLSPRLSAAELRELRQAAERERRSITSYMVTRALEAARAANAEAAS